MGEYGLVAYAFSAMQCEVRFLPSKRTVRVARGTSLLEAARRAGLPVARACDGEGVCARCGVQIVAGASQLEPESRSEAEAKRRNRVDSGDRLSCQLKLERDVTVTARHW
jgi:2Fe-2S ferredoxin